MARSPMDGVEVSICECVCPVALWADRLGLCAPAATIKYGEALA
jgi:hypothetical protein